MVSSLVTGGENSVLLDRSLSGMIKIGTHVRDDRSGVSLKVVGFLEDKTFSHTPVALISLDTWKQISGGLDKTEFNGIAINNLVPYLKVEEQLSLVLKMANQWTKESKRKINEMLIAVGMEHRSKFYPHQLSGGEKQRVAIARAFINEPDIILADEPTASLDSSRSMAIIELISKIVIEQKKSAIIVTHDEQILPYCDRIFGMKDGQLVEQGKRD